MGKNTNPLRKVVRVFTKKAETGMSAGLYVVFEELDCGHALAAPMGLGAGPKAAQRRRCWLCA